MIFKINRVRGVVKLQVPAKLHQAACSGSWLIVCTENTIQSIHYRPDSNSVFTMATMWRQTAQRK